MLKFLNYIRKLGFQSLPIYKKETYVFKEDDYRLDFQFQLEIEKEIDIIDDLYIYGWVIESTLTKYAGKPVDREVWLNHWNHKIYNSKQSALDAINQMDYCKSTFTFRIKPMYTFKNNGWRNHIINKIIKEDKK